MLTACSGGSGPAGTISCQEDMDCPADYFCDTAMGICAMGCQSDEGCLEPGLEYCDLAAHVCVGCTDASQCEAGEYCDPATQACAPGCGDDAACADAMGQTHCDPMTRVCVECTDDAHCGAGTFCDANVCRSGCDATHSCEGDGETCCGEVCVDLMVSPGNCGGCDMACADTEVCVGGTCGLPCPEGQLRCGDECVIATNDPSNCGSCGNLCAVDEVCGLGVCRDACPMGQEDCSGSCASLATDARHCGLCGNACADGYRCTDGSCQLDCPAEQTDCGDMCVNLLTDRTNCGSCDYACLSGQVCVDGLCEISCPSEPVLQTPCDGVCVDLSTDPDHCGACGNICRQGCFMGACAGVADIAISQYESCIRYTSGRIFCWGANNVVTTGSGGGRFHVRSPVEVDDAIGRPIENMDSIDMGGRNACGVRSDGRAVCWGSYMGSHPRVIPDLDRVTQVSGNGRYWVALKTDGTVWEFTASTATELMGLTSVVQLSRGGDHVCARLRSGSVRCWGANNYGQLGDGSRTAAAAADAVTVMGITDAVDLWAGTHYTCARESDGRVYCWGRNQYGQLGNGTTVDERAPVEIASLRGAVQVSLKWDHACAVMPAGTISCWGRNRYAQLGDGTTMERLAPVTVASLSAQRFVSVGQNHSCAVGMDDEVRCWGRNDYGQAGGDTEGAPRPVELSGLRNIVKMARGFYSRCFLEAGGRVQCMGETRGGGTYSGNAYGQLGRGPTPGDTLIPAPVVGISTATDIGAGTYHHCALLSTGSVSCWGQGDHGNLGNGADISSNVPVTVSGITDAIELAVGAYHACVRRRSGIISCWGRNFSGELGDGTEINRNRPINVPGFSGSIAAAIRTGAFHSCVRRTDGRVQCWGSNTAMQVGDGTRTNKSRPTFVLQRCSGGVSRADCDTQLTGVGWLGCWTSYCRVGDDATDIRGRFWGGATTPSGWAGFAAENTTYFGRTDFNSGNGVYGYIMNTGAMMQETHMVGRSEFGNALGGFTYSYPLPAGGTGYRGATISTDYTQVLAGTTFLTPSCGLTPAGRVECWGRTAHDQLSAAGLDDITRTPALIPPPSPLE